MFPHSALAEAASCWMQKRVQENYAHCIQYRFVDVSSSCFSLLQFSTHLYWTYWYRFANVSTSTHWGGLQKSVLVGIDLQMSVFVVIGLCNLVSVGIDVYESLLIGICVQKSVLCGIILQKSVLYEVCRSQYSFMGVCRCHIQLVLVSNSQQWLVQVCRYPYCYNSLYNQYMLVQHCRSHYSFIQVYIIYFLVGIWLYTLSYGVVKAITDWYRFVQVSTRWNSSLEVSTNWQVEVTTLS